MNSSLIPQAALPLCGYCSYGTRLVPGIYSATIDADWIFLGRLASIFSCFASASRLFSDKMGKCLERRAHCKIQHSGTELSRQDIRRNFSRDLLNLTDILFPAVQFCSHGGERAHLISRWKSSRVGAF